MYEYDDLDALLADLEDHDPVATLQAQQKHGTSARVSRPLDLDGRHLDDGTPASSEPWFPGLGRPLLIFRRDGLGNTAADADEADEAGEDQ